MKYNWKYYKSVLLKAWNDPVWSKIIGSALYALISVPISGIRSLIESENFLTTFYRFWTQQFSLWIFAVSALLLVLLPIIIEKFKGPPTFVYDEGSLNLDKALFEKIRKVMLPQHGTIAFLRAHDFASRFQLASLNNFDSVAQEFEHPDFEFLNPSLEQIKNELIDEIDRFINYSKNNTFMEPDGSQSVPREWDHDNSGRFWPIVKELNQRATNVCSKYDELIKTGRRLLKI